MIDRVNAGRKKVDLNRLCDIGFPRLVADPVGSVRMIYDKFGYEFTPEYEQRILKFACENKPSSRPKHVYSLEQFNLDGNEIDEVFAEYHQQHGLDS